MKVSNKSIVHWLMPKNKTVRFELLNDIGHCLEQRGNPDQVIVKCYLQLSQRASVKAKRLTSEDILLNVRSSSGRTKLVTGSRHSESHNNDISYILKYSGSKCKEELTLPTKRTNQALHDNESSIEIRLSADSNTNSSEGSEDVEMQVENKLECIVEDKTSSITRNASVTEVSGVGECMKEPNVQKTQSVFDEKCCKESRGNVNHPVKDIVEKSIDKREEVGLSVKHSSNGDKCNQEENAKTKCNGEQLILGLKSQISHVVIYETNTGENKKKENPISWQSENFKNDGYFLKNYENDQTSQSVADKCGLKLLTKESNAGKTVAKANHLEKHSLDVCTEDHDIAPENHGSTLGCNENITSLNEQVKPVHKTDSAFKYNPASAHINKVQITKLQERLEQSLKNKRSSTSCNKTYSESDYGKNIASNNKIISENLSESKPLITVRKNLFNPPNNKGVQRDGFMTGNLLNSGMSSNENTVNSLDVNEELFTSSKSPKSNAGNSFVTEKIIIDNSLQLQKNKDIVKESENNMSMSTDDINSRCYSYKNNIIRFNPHDKIHNICPLSVKELEKVSNSKTNNSNKLFSEHPQKESFESDLKQFTSEVKYLEQHLTAKKRAATFSAEIGKQSKMRRFSDDQIRSSPTLNSTLRIYNSSKKCSNLRRFSEQSIRPEIALQTIPNNSYHPSTKSDLLPFEPEITLESLLYSSSHQGTMLQQKEVGSASVSSIQKPVKNMTNEKDINLKQLLQGNKNKMVQDKCGLEHHKQTITVLANKNYSLNTAEVAVHDTTQKGCQTTVEAHSSQITPKLGGITTKAGLLGEVNNIVSDNTVSSSTLFDFQIENNVQNKSQSNQMIEEKQNDQIIQPVSLSEQSVQNESCTILHSNKESFIHNAVDLVIDFFKFELSADKQTNCVPSEVSDSILQYIHAKATSTQNITLHHAMRSYLELYTKYVDEPVSAKINKTAELLHLAIADWNRRKERKTRALRLTSELLRKEEINRAENDYKEMVSLRGVKFREIFLSILNHFKECEYVLLASLYFRISISLMNIDKENINYVSSVRSLILSLLKNGTIELNEACNRFLFLQNEELNNTYKFVKQCLVSLCIVGCPLSEGKDILKYAHTDPFPIQLEQLKSVLIARNQASMAAKVEMGNTIHGNNELISTKTNHGDSLLHQEPSSVLNRGSLQKARPQEQARFHAIVSVNQNIANQPLSSHQKSYSGKLHALKQGLQKKILAQKQLPTHKKFQTPILQQIIQAPQNERNPQTSQTPVLHTFHNHLSHHGIMHESGIVVTAQHAGIHINDIVDQADQLPPYSQPYVAEHNNSRNPEDDWQQFFHSKEQSNSGFGNTTNKIIEKEKSSNLSQTSCKPVNSLLPIERRPVTTSLSREHNVIPCSTKKRDLIKIAAMNRMEVPQLRYCSSNGCSQLATLACGHCTTVFYCTRDCQARDWYSQHSRSCQESELAVKFQ